MDKWLQVGSTNQINKYGYRVLASAFVHSLWDTCDIGVPSHLAHDSSVLLGWMLPRTVFFEPGLVRDTHTCLMPESENNDDFELLERYWLLYQEKLHYLNQNVIVQLKKQLEKFFMGQEKVVLRPSIAYVEKDLAVRVFPRIFELAKKDKDNLISVSELNPIGPGVYQEGELLLFAHPFFRRSLYRLNTLNAPFLKELQDLDQNLNPRVALDRDMIGLASEYKEPIELTYWWGPKFDDNLVNIVLGVTHHGAEESDRIFYGIEATDFWWKSRNGEQEFEVEEIVNRPIIDSADDMEQLKYGCRYMHSMITEKNKIIHHLDGAIRAYTEEQLQERNEKGFKATGKHTEYFKLWRIDGNIDIVTWKGLVSDYFRDNMLIGEYLGGVDNNEFVISENNLQTEDTNNVALGYVPYTMDAGQGIRLAITYDFAPYDQGDSACEFISTLTLGNGDSLLESGSLELKKILSKIGVSCAMPENCKIVSFKDRYSNISTLYCAKYLEMSEKIYEALRLYVNGVRHRVEDAVLLYRLRFQVDDRDVTVSTMGHVIDICKWLDNPLSHIPASRTEIEKWANSVSDYLDNEFPTMKHDIPLDEIITEQGVLTIKRIPVTDAEYVKDGVEFGIKFDPDDIQMKLIEHENIIPTTAYLVTRSTCTKCNEAYQACSCSVLLDHTSQRLDKVDFLSPFWTDRPAPVIWK